MWRLAVVGRDQVRPDRRRVVRPALRRSTAPVPESPVNDAQLDTLRPTLIVRNGTSTGTGPRTYEFQVSDTGLHDHVLAHVTGLAVVVSQAGVAEGTGGTTSFTPGTDLQPSTRCTGGRGSLKAEHVGMVGHRAVPHEAGRVQPGGRTLRSADSRRDDRHAGRAARRFRVAAGCAWTTRRHGCATSWRPRSRAARFRSRSRGCGPTARA